MSKRINKLMWRILGNIRWASSGIYNKLYPVEKRRPYVPQHLWLETTNRCDANCVFCARECVPPLCDMDFDLYKKIIKANPKAKIVQTQGFGEPLLYPHIVEAIAYAYKPGRKTMFYTNAYSLDKSMSERLLDAGLRQINFSVDACNKEDFESVRIGLKWEVVLENINQFQKLRNKGGYPTLTMVRICETKENSPQIPRIVKFWERRVDVVSVLPEVYIPHPTTLGNNPYVSGSPIKCIRPYQHLSVKSNGDLVLCCRDWFHVYKMDNLSDTSIHEAYNNAVFNKVRSSLQTGDSYPTICYYCQVNLPEPRGLKGE